MSQQLSEKLLRMLKLDSVTVSLLISKWKERQRHCLVKIQEMVSVVLILFLKYVCCECGDWCSCNINPINKSPFVPNWLVSHSEHSDVSDRTWNTKVCHITHKVCFAINHDFMKWPWASFAKHESTHMSKELRKSAILLIDPVISSIYSLCVTLTWWTQWTIEKLWKQNCMTVFNAVAYGSVFTYLPNPPVFVSEVPP